jgi:hypothetical protein
MDGKKCIAGLQPIDLQDAAAPPRIATTCRCRPELDQCYVGDALRFT